MGLFKKTPEELAENERRRVEAERITAEKAFAATPAGQSRAALAAGQKIFQIDMPLSKTTGRTVAMIGAYAGSTKTIDYSSTIQSIEKEGWRLEHAGYVYRVTGSVSRDKFLASGQQEAVSGEIVGIYIFRSVG